MYSFTRECANCRHGSVCRGQLVFIDRAKWKPRSIFSFTIQVRNSNSVFKKMIKKNKHSYGASIYLSSASLEEEGGCQHFQSYDVVLPYL